MLHNHLRNKTNYKQITASSASAQLKNQQKEFTDLFIKHKHERTETVYFKKSLEEPDFRKPVFNGLWKLYKGKLFIRLVISLCRSISKIFSIYIDECLKSLVQDFLTTYLTSAKQLVYILSTTFPKGLPKGARPFSVDIIGMYNNILSHHRVKIIRKCITKYKHLIKNTHIPIVFVVVSLEIIITDKIFQYSDKFWRQLIGAAMAKSCAINYMFLYDGYLEMQSILKDFAFWMTFYRRFIDDSIVIRLTNLPGSTQAWRDFQQRLNSWGALCWTHTGLVKQIEFLDLSVSINTANHLEFKMHQNKMNLYLYIPTNSVHSPDLICSIVFGIFHAYFLHNTHQKDYVSNCSFLAQHLGKQGWEWKNLKIHFNKAHSYLIKQGKKSMLALAMMTRKEKAQANSSKEEKKLLVFNLPFHPRGVQQQQISQFYRETLAPLMNNRKLVVAQCRLVNIWNRVCYLALEDIPGDSPSDLLQLCLKKRN